jgi:hypothetical protein
MLFTANDFGPETFVVRDDGAPGCDAMPSEWAWLRDPIRGEGLYFTRRRFHVGKGVLQPVRRPVVVERVGIEGKQWWPIDPTADAPVREVAYGVVMATTLEKDESAPDFLGLTVRLSDGMTVSFPAVDAETLAPSRIGDRATGVAYPEGYVPVDPRAFVGAAVEVVRYGVAEYPKLAPVIWVRTR